MLESCHLIRISLGLLALKHLQVFVFALFFWHQPLFCWLCCHPHFLCVNFSNVLIEMSLIYTYWLQIVSIVIPQLCASLNAHHEKCSHHLPPYKEIPILLAIFLRGTSVPILSQDSAGQGNSRRGTNPGVGRGIKTQGSLPPPFFWHYPLSFSPHFSGLFITEWIWLVSYYLSAGLTWTRDFPHKASDLISRFMGKLVCSSCCYVRLNWNEQGLTLLNIHYVSVAFFFLPTI